MIISGESVTEFTEYMRKNGKAESTIKKYAYELQRFVEFVGGKELTQEVADCFYKHMLKTRKTPHSQNRISSITNIFLEFLGVNNIRLTMAKYDCHKLYSKKNEELTPAELKQMLDYAIVQGKLRTALIIGTLAYTGIRVQELKYITVEALHQGYVDVPQRGLCHRISLPDIIKERLNTYVRAQAIASGAIFITRNGTPCIERYITTDIQKIAKQAGIPDGKANPTAIRQLFAKTYFSKYGDLAGLTDLLGIKHMSSAVLYVKESVQDVGL